MIFTGESDPTNYGQSPRLQSTRGLLLAGFGGLLLLMVAAGLETIHAFRMIQMRNDAIRTEFLTRNRLLNQIRSDLYLSGTYVRDYLIEPDQDKASAHRDSLEADRRDMESALHEYTRMARATEQRPTVNLGTELSRYWAVLRPALQWNSAERQARAVSFLRDEVYPRRAAMLRVADEIATLNEQQSDAGNQQVSELFSGFRLRIELTLLLSLLFGILLAGYSVKRVLQLEQQSESRLTESVQARSELKRLSASLVAAQETERRALSRELHDEVGQALSALMVGFTNLAASVPRESSPALHSQIEELRKLASGCVGIVRNMTLLLRPSMLDDLGLVPALQWQAREIAKRSGLTITFDGDELGEELPDEHRTAVYRVVQEALHNCEKHASAQNVRVTLRQHKDTLLLSIQDDGRGFDPRTTKGIGTRGMQERIENLGGIFNVESGKDHGTLVTVRIPLGRTTRPASAAELLCK